MMSAPISEYDAVISVTLCLKRSEWQSSAGTWKGKTLTLNIQQERLRSWRSSCWRQLRLWLYDLQNCNDRGQSKTQHWGQRHGDCVSEAAQAWKIALVVLQADGRVVISHHHCPQTVDELLDILFLVHKIMWTRSWEAKNTVAVDQVVQEGAGTERQRPWWGQRWLKNFKNLYVKVQFLLLNTQTQP